FFPIVVSTFDGLTSVDPDAVRLIRSMGATGSQLFWRVRWPAALPSLFSGTRIGVTYGVIGAIVGDWVGGSRGIGIYMMRAADQLLTERVFAAIVVSSALSIALFLLVGAVERAALPWRRRAALALLATSGLGCGRRLRGEPEPTPTSPGDDAAVPTATPRPPDPSPT